MHIEHELPERAFHARQALLQHDKTRAGEFRRQFEIHHAERFAQIEMLLGREGIIAFCAMLMTLDIAVLVRAVRHVVGRQIGDLREQTISALPSNSLRRLLQMTDSFFEFGHFGHQILRVASSFLGLRFANFLRRRVAPRLRLFEIW